MSAINNPSDQPGKAVLRPHVTLDRPMPKKRRGIFSWFTGRQYHMPRLIRLVQCLISSDLVAFLADKEVFQVFRLSPAVGLQMISSYPGLPGFQMISRCDFQMILQVLQVSSRPLQAVQVLQAMRLALTPLFNIMFRTIIGSMGSKST